MAVCHSDYGAKVLSQKDGFSFIVYKTRVSNTNDVTPVPSSRSSKVSVQEMADECIL